MLHVLEAILAPDISKNYYQLGNSPRIDSHCTKTNRCAENTTGTVSYHTDVVRFKFKQENVSGNLDISNVGSFSGF